MNKNELKDGMTLVQRNGGEVDYYKGYMVDFESEGIMKMDKYNDDLTYNDRKCNFWDICKIIKNESIIWEREDIDWSKVPFGAKVRCWDDINNKFEGKFLGYDEETNIYVVFVSTDRVTDWVYCELVEDPKEEVTYREMMVSVHKHCDEHYGKNNTCEGCIALKPNGCCDIGMIADENFNMTRK